MVIGFIIQFLCLITATTIVAGGGQFPGNKAGMLIYLKLVLFLIPVAVAGFRIFTDRLTMRDIATFLCRYKLLGIYLLSLIISLPLSLSPTFSLGRYLYTLLGFGSLFCLMMQYDEKILTVYKYGIYIFSGIVTLFLCLAHMISAYPELRYAVQDMGLVHPNLLSSLLAQMFLVVLLLPGQNIIRILGSAILLTAIIMLQSRGVWIALSISLLVSLLVQILFYHSRQALLGFLALAIAGVTLVIIMLIQPFLLDNILTIFSRGASVDDLLSLSNRIDLWKILLQDVGLKEILVGHGYALMYSDIGADFGSGILYGAHNGYLAILLGSGIVPLILWLAYWSIQKITLMLRRHSLSPALVTLSLASLTMIFVHALVAEEFGMQLTPTLMLVLLNFHYTMPEAKA